MKTLRYLPLTLLTTLALPALADATAIRGTRLLVALEDGAALEINARTGEKLADLQTGPNAFGALYSADGTKAYVTDKTTGTLSEIAVASGKITSVLELGKTPQQPVMTSDGRIFAPMSGEGVIAVARSEASGLKLVRKIPVGEGTKPHILSLSPDEKTLYATVQGKDPKVVALSIATEPETVTTEFRYDVVPRVLAATNAGAYFTAHHSTGLHYADLASGKSSTPFMDRFGAHSEARKQIEGVAATADGKLVGMTHEGRRALIVAKPTADGKLAKTCHLAPLAANPYWVTIDPSEKVAFVSIPDAGLVEAYDIDRCSSRPIWSAKVGGKAKRMAVTEGKAL